MAKRCLSDDVRNRARRRQRAAQMPLTVPGELTPGELRQLAHPKFRWRLARTVSIATMSVAALGAYLAGLIEGDGHFSKNGLSIYFDTRDLALVQALCRRLGLDPAKASRRDRRKLQNGLLGDGCYSLNINVGHPVMDWVLRATDGHWVGPHKRDQIIACRHHEVFIGRCASSPRVKAQGWIPRPGLTLAPPDPNNARGWWLAGFGDADMSAFLTARRVPIITFSQSDPAPLLAIQARFQGLALARYDRTYRYVTKAGVQTSVTVPEYGLHARSLDALRELFAHYACYPAQGIKHGHLFLLYQAHLLTRRLHQRTHRRASRLRRRVERLRKIRAALTTTDVDGRVMFHAVGGGAGPGMPWERARQLQYRLTVLSLDMMPGSVVVRSWGPWGGLDGDDHRGVSAERVFWAGMTSTSDD